MIEKWDLYQKFDPVVRIFGSDKDVKEEKTNLVNPSSLERQLLRLAGQKDE